MNQREKEKTFRIIIVDDWPIISQDLKNTLNRHYKNKNVKVITCTNATQCIKKLKEKEYNLIILDILLCDKNKMNGLELAKYINCSYKNTNIVFLSSFNSQELNFKQISLKEINYLKYINKPYNQNELFEIINRLLNIEGN